MNKFKKTNEIFSLECIQIILNFDHTFNIYFFFKKLKFTNNDTFIGYFVKNNNRKEN